MTDGKTQTYKWNSRALYQQTIFKLSNAIQEEK